MSYATYRFTIFTLKFIAASFSVGFILSWFDLTPDALISMVGASPMDLLLSIWSAVVWTIPHIILGAAIIAPLWGFAYLVRPPQD